LKFIESQKNIGELRSELEELKGWYDSLQIENEQFNQEMDQVKKEHQNQMGNLNEYFNHLISELKAEYQSQIDDLNQKHIELQSKNNELNLKNSEFQSQVHEINQKNSDLQTLMNQEKNVAEQYNSKYLEFRKNMIE
jgi:uncharacterized protein YmfQ (DUF2313 family)